MLPVVGALIASLSMPTIKSVGTSCAEYSLIVRRLEKYLLFIYVIFISVLIPYQCQIKDNNLFGITKTLASYYSLLFSHVIIAICYFGKLFIVSKMVIS